MMDGRSGPLRSQVMPYLRWRANPDQTVSSLPTISSLAAPTDAWNCTIFQPPERRARVAVILGMAAGPLGKTISAFTAPQPMPGRALAAATGQHFSRVSKLGVQAPSGQDIRDWCQACGAEEQIPDLIATARVVQSAYLEFRRQARAGMKRVLGAHTNRLYERTSLFRIYEHNVIPGLLQTAAYCAAMLSFWIDFLGTPDDLDAAVAARMERQRVIYQAGQAVCRRSGGTGFADLVRQCRGTGRAAGPAAGGDVGTGRFPRDHSDDDRAGPQSPQRDSGSSTSPWLRWRHPPRASR